MRPNRLQLTNFLAYGDCELFLSDVHVACLVGDNGAGKSCLLDAITWAIWGKARGRRDVSLIRLGAEFTEVALDFDHAGHLYRIVRRRESGGRLRLTLVRHEGANEWTHESESAAATANQKAIDALLKIDYETFVNTAFLRQGEADAFTTETPAKRKAVLRDILQLNRWNDYHDAARAAYREIDHGLSGDRGKLEMLAEMIAARPEAEAFLAHMERTAADAETVLAGYAEQLEAIQKIEAEIAVKREAVAMAEAASQQAAERINRIERRMREIDGEMDDCREYLKDREEIEAGYANLSEAQAVHGAMAARREQAQKWQTTIVKATADIKVARAELTTSIITRDRAVNECESNIADLTEALAQPVTVCKTCGQALSEEAAGDVRYKMRQEIDKWEERRVRHETMIAAINVRIADDDYARDAFDKIAEAEAALAEIGFDADAYQAAAAAMNDLAAYEGLHDALTGAEARLQQFTDELAPLTSERDLAAADAERLQSDLEKDQRWLNELSDSVTNAEDVRTHHKMAEITARRERANAAAAQKRLDDIAEHERKHAEISAVVGSTEERLANIGELIAAFGRDGVPLMVIKSVTGEIEAEANNILQRITNEALSIKLLTEREKASGGVKDALDIQVSDSLGVRDYEMYSGGEAYRIDIAIRVALSKVLARRAGAQLRTLFIDEGFGSQDAYGREQLIRTITQLGAEFDMILVVTHLEELRDRFDTRIAVTKRAGGSVAEVA